MSAGILPRSERVAMVVLDVPNEAGATAA